MNSWCGAVHVVAMNTNKFCNNDNTVILGYILWQYCIILIFMIPLNTNNYDIMYVYAFSTELIIPLQNQLQ